MTTRSEHLAWCKQRALEYVNRGDAQDGLMSMFSDLGKHPETTNHRGIEIGVLLMVAGALDGPDHARDFINGFN